MNDQLLTPEQVHAEVDDRVARRRMAAAVIWSEIASKACPVINESLIRAADEHLCNDKSPIPRRELSSILSSALVRSGCQISDPLHYEVCSVVRVNLLASGYRFTKDGGLLL